MRLRCGLSLPSRTVGLTDTANLCFRVTLLFAICARLDVNISKLCDHHMYECCYAAVY
jgi:hypothetical protein